MTRSTCFAVAVAAAGCLVAGELAAQTVVAFQPVTTFYAPAAPVTRVVASPVFASPVVTQQVVAAPVFASSPVVQTSFYAPAATTFAAAPVATTCCSPVVSAPVVAAPVSTVAVVRPPQVAWQATPQVVTRHRPILGGTVSRVHNVWTPVVW